MEMQTLRICPGDSLFNLFGNNWKYIYNLPENAKFKALFPDPTNIKRSYPIHFPHDLKPHYAEDMKWFNFASHQKFRELFFQWDQDFVPQLPTKEKAIVFGISKFWNVFGLYLSYLLKFYYRTVIFAYSPYLLLFADRYKDNLSYLDHLRHIQCVDMSVQCLQHNEYQRLIEQQSELDCAYIDGLDAPSRTDIFDLRCRRNNMASATFDTLVTKETHVYMPNGHILEPGIIKTLCRKQGVPFATYENHFLNPKVLLINRNNDYAKFSHEWENRQPLAHDEILEVDDALNSQIFLEKHTISNFQPISVTDNNNRKYTEKLKSKKVMLISPGVNNDSCTLGHGIIYKGMHEWIRKTIEYANQHDDWIVVIRCHPMESLWGMDPWELVENVFADYASDKVIIIKSDEKFNSFSLVEHIKVCVTWISTVGVEMTMLGVPTVVVGDAGYRGKGFTLDPKTEDEYFAMLEQVMNHERVNMSQQISLAKEYYFMLLRMLITDVGFSVSKVDETWQIRPNDVILRKLVIQ